MGSSRRSQRRPRLEHPCLGAGLATDLSTRGTPSSDHRARRERADRTRSFLRGSPPWCAHGPLPGTDAPAQPAPRHPGQTGGRRRHLVGAASATSGAGSLRSRGRREPRRAARSGRLVPLHRTRRPVHDHPAPTGDKRCGLPSQPKGPAQRRGAETAHGRARGVTAGGGPGRRTCRDRGPTPRAVTRDAGGPTGSVQAGGTRGAGPRASTRSGARRRRSWACAARPRQPRRSARSLHRESRGWEHRPAAPQGVRHRVQALLAWRGVRSRRPLMGARTGYPRVRPRHRCGPAQATVDGHRVRNRARGVRPLSALPRHDPCPPGARLGVRPGPGPRRSAGPKNAT
jgi:hypothetical protein